MLIIRFYFISFLSFSFFFYFSLLRLNMGPSSDIPSSQTHTEGALTTDATKLTTNSKESADTQSFAQLAIDQWIDTLENPESKRGLYDEAYDLFKLLRGALEHAIKHERLRSFIPDMKSFLLDEKAEYKLDDCIRWLILDSAVAHCQLGTEDVGLSAVQTEAAEENITGERNICIIIIRIIIEIRPHLSFTRLQTGRVFPRLFPALTQKQLAAECLFKEDHTKEQKNGCSSTPLHKAATKGNGKAIKHMIYCAQHFQPDILLQILKLENPDLSSEKTALSLAALAENLGALHVFLNYNTGIADAPDTTFKEALKEGRRDVVEVFLRQPEFKQKLANTDYILLAIQPLEEMNAKLIEDENFTEKYNKQVEVINVMIKAAEDQQRRTDEKVIEKIIQLNLENVWNENEGKWDMSGLLHLAVQHQNIGFVKKFLQYDELVTSQSHKRYPLWHNNNIVENSTSTRRVLKDDDSARTHREIRNLIVAATIKSKKVSKMQDLFEIFQLSDGTYELNKAPLPL